MRILLILVSLLIYCFTFGQRILIEESIFLEEEKLLLFPLVDNQNHFRYLSTNIELAKNKEGRPEFLFMEFVNSEQLIVDNRLYVPLDGGAYIHFLVELKYPSNIQLQAAEEKLAKRLKKNIAKILGPIGIKDAGVSIISSTLRASPQLLWNGENNTPVFEGGKIAQSFKIDMLEAKTLKASLNANASDVAIALDLSVYGFSSPREAQIKINWNRLYEYKNESKNQNFIFYKKEAQEVIRELNNKAIIAYEPVEAEELNGLPNAVYEKLINIIFEPIPPEEQPLIKKKGLGGISNLIDKALGTNLTPLLNIGLNSAYKYRKEEVKVNAELNFKGYELINQNFLVSSNLNDLLINNSKDEFIKVIDISQDIDGKGRKLQLDARKYLHDFKDILERIEIVFKKNHGNGKTTHKRLGLEANNIDDIHYFSYANGGRQAYKDWEEYEIQTTWHFKDGTFWTSPWNQFTTDFIPLKCPYKAETIEVLVDSTILNIGQVNRLDLQFEYQRFGESTPVFIQKHLYPDSPNEDKNIQIIRKANESINVPYTIRYKIRGQAGYKEQKGTFIGGFIDTDLDDKD